MADLFQEIFYQPLFNALIFLYQTVALRDLGLAIIFLTIAVRIILYPFFHQQARHQRLTQQLQPEIQKIRKKHQKNREAQTRAVMALYKEHRMNPLAPMLALVVQLPVLFALYFIFVRDPSGSLNSLLYSFVSHPGELNHTFFGLINLKEKSEILAVLAALAQYFQGKLSFSGNVPGQAKEFAQMMRLMVWAGPVIALVVLFRLPAALGLYWITTTIFSIIQQVVVNRRLGYAGTSPQS